MLVDGFVIVNRSNPVCVNLSTETFSNYGFDVVSLHHMEEKQDYLLLVWNCRMDIDHVTNIIKLDHFKILDIIYRKVVNNNILDAMDKLQGQCKQNLLAEIRNAKKCNGLFRLSKHLSHYEHNVMDQFATSCGNGTNLFMLRTKYKP